MFPFPVDKHDKWVLREQLFLLGQVDGAEAMRKVLSTLTRNYVSIFQRNPGRGRFSSSLAEILDQVKNSSISTSKAMDLIQSKESPQFLLESFANLDHSRHRRTGFPEAVFAEGKSAEQTVAILDDFARRINESVRAGEENMRVNTAILATRYGFIFSLIAS